ncbi:YTH domain-containing protein ECT4-like [Lolium rigidum]|uniref:YTH domain-containing protein ECT4-like n=1 Tax=Lolium rigidum TaxID=89674 RepID=UPI001F5C8AE8|nr:YTH domain-containing protein ECT4-like [Lolium rigidum]XP_047063135.1 YTH domain-containing protein ECT4-like [Lolium rigidum]
MKEAFHPPLTLHMKEAFDPPAAKPPETQNTTSSCIINNVMADVLADRDAISSQRQCTRPAHIPAQPHAISSHHPWDGMKSQDDTDFLRHAHTTLSLLDYQEKSLEGKYATDIGSHVYSKQAISPQSEYDRQQPYFPLSSSCWENSSSLETRPGNRDTSGHAGITSNIFGPRDDYLSSYPTGPIVRRSYQEAAKVDFSLDFHSEHRYEGLDRFTSFSKCNGQSIEPRSEIVDLSRGAHCLDETASFSSRWCFKNGGRGPSLTRGLVYGDEIPSLSSRSCNGNGVLSSSGPWSYGAETPSLSSRQGYGDEIPSLSNQKFNGISRSSQWHHSAEIPSLSSRQIYGDEIPSLSTQKSNGILYSRQWQQYDADIPSFSSRQGYDEDISVLSPHWRFRDRIPLYSGQRCHDAEARRLSSYQQGASRGSGNPRGYQQGSSRGSRHLGNNFGHGLVSNQQVRVTTTRHTSTRPRVANRVVSNTNYCRNSKKENPSRNSEDIRDQVCGPRASKLNSASTPSTKKDILSPLVRRDQFNRSDFSVQYENAKFFMIKSYSEDDIHKGIKYNVWASTPNGNNKLDAAFHDAQALTKEKGTKCPVFLLFSVNTSGQFVGMAEMLGPVDFKKTMDFWQQNKWSGFFPVVWHIIKDIPNRLFKHITLENNDNRPVTFSRDTQEIGLPQGLEVLKIFKTYRHGTSILDDFDFYEEKENTRCAQKGIDADSLHEARVSYFGTDDLKSMGDIETSMESINLHEPWD